MVISHLRSPLLAPAASLFPKSVQKGILKAAEFAQLSQCPNFRVGAVIFRNGKMVDGGWNWHKKTHPQSTARNKGIHAEFHCLSRCSRIELQGVVLFVARITKDGRLAIARPCFSCQLLLQDRGFKRIYYTDRNGGIGELRI